MSQALMLMHQLLSGRNAVSDRFYRALYAVLLTEGARGAAGWGCFLNFICKVLLCLVCS
jgi:ribosome biogenesis protein MAK21